MSDIKPYIHAREHFAGNFYRMISYEEKVYFISPAAVLKLLVTTALGANISLADEIFWDLYIKHVEKEKLREEAAKEGIFDIGFAVGVQERLEAELSEYIKTENLLEFFKQDFTELGDKVEVENYIAVNGKNKLKADYQKLAKECFNVTVIHKNMEAEKKLLQKHFSNLATEAGVDLFGAVSFKFKLPSPFVSKADGSFEAVGTFNYANIKNYSSSSFRTDVVEIVLDAEIPLKMLVFLPNDFQTLLSQSIGRDYMDFNAIAARLNPKVVKIILPKMNMETKYRLSSFFRKNFGHRGLNDLLRKRKILDRLFEKTEDMAMDFGTYWQYTSLTMTAGSGDANPSIAEPEVTLDATRQPFLFVINSDKVLYIIGHHDIPE